MTKMSNPGWGAVLVGEAANLGDWTFIEGVRTVVEVHTGHTILRSASLDELTSASEVRDRATALIERLNGALALSQRTKPLRFGSVVQLDPNGVRRGSVAVHGTYEVGGRDADLIRTFTDLDGNLNPVKRRIGRRLLTATSCWTTPSSTLVGSEHHSLHGSTSPRYVLSSGPQYKLPADLAAYSPASVFWRGPVLDAEQPRVPQPLLLCIRPVPRLQEFPPVLPINRSATTSARRPPNCPQHLAKIWAARWPQIATNWHERAYWRGGHSFFSYR